MGRPDIGIYVPLGRLHGAAWEPFRQNIFRLAHEVFRENAPEDIPALAAGKAIWFTGWACFGLARRCALLLAAAELGLVRSMRALVVWLVFAASAFASDSLRELAADEYGPGDQAKAAGVDYIAAVKRAERGEAAGLSTLFRVTKHLDGHGSETHCIVLRRLLEKSGDKRFSDALRVESADTQKRVLESLDFDFAAPWQKKLPLTYSLGPHNMNLLQEHK